MESNTKFQVYVVSGDRKTFTNIGGEITAKNERDAIRQQKASNETPRSMGRATWRAQEIK